MLHIRMMKPNYKRIEEIEFGQLKGLMKELGYELKTPQIVQNIQEIRSRGGEVFVAKINEIVVGCVCTIIDVRLAAGINGEIVSLVVSEHYRGIGIGKGLVELAESWLKQRVARIRVRANITRFKAHEFYIKAGYQELKTQKIFEKYV